MIDDDSEETQATPEAGVNENQPRPPTRPEKRSFTIAGHRTSISLEAAFWDSLKDIAAREGRSLASIVGSIDQNRGSAGLSGAVRIWVLDYFRSRIQPPSGDGSDV